MTTLAVRCWLAYSVDGKLRRHYLNPRAREEELYLIEREQAKRRLEKDFRVYLRKFWRVLNPATVLKEASYIDAIAEQTMSPCGWRWA